MNAAENLRSDPHAEPSAAIVYFSPEEGGNAPELLLFEEASVQPPDWKGKASLKGKELWQRTRVRLERLTSDLFASDRFVHRLNKLRKITVLLNRPIEPAVVRARLIRIVKDHSYHHLRWLIIDGILLPFSLLIAPLPGPNVVGYYLLFRVYFHWKSFRSASDANLTDIDVRVSERAGEVDALLRGSSDMRSALQEVRSKYGLRALQEHRFVPQLSLMKEAWRRMKHAFSHEEEA